MAGTAGLLACCVTLHASLLPTLRLDGACIKVFNDYIEQFENSVLAPFAASGRLWIDSDAKKSAFDSGKPVVEPRENQDVANGSGSIHHYSGALRVNRATIAQLRRIMQDYPNYPRYFRPDVTAGAGEIQPDSTPQDEHFHTKLQLTESTLWLQVVFDTVYDTHYRRIAPDRWTSRSGSLRIREMIDPKNPSAGFYPEGNDHGFLWKTNTYWFARERGGGLDLEADSITLSRSNVPGFGWWGARRSHDAVEKMLRDIKAAIESAH
jgi:hypothetical protein